MCFLGWVNVLLTGRMHGFRQLMMGWVGMKHIVQLLLVKTAAQGVLDEAGDFFAIILKIRQFCSNQIKFVYLQELR